jgi:nitronate monooxygenase
VGAIVQSVGMSVLDTIPCPVVLAPLAGGPSTPALAAAVTEAGGLGFLAGGYLSAEQLAERLAHARRLTRGPLGVNLFVPAAGPTDPSTYADFVDRLRGWTSDRGLELGEPRFDDDAWAGKLDLIRRARPAVASFTFGCPEPAVIRALQEDEIEVWVTITHPDEAARAVAAGANVLIVQGAEAGGHRASFVDDPERPPVGLLALLSLLAGARRPLVASGAIATGAGLAAVLAAGGSAGQVGTAFLLCPEAGTADAHRAALRGAAPTELTRAFTGRLARGIRNEFMREHGRHAPVAYPELHYLTAPLRQRARQAGDPDLINLWAGEAYPLARERLAAEVVRDLAEGATAILRRASGERDNG